MKKKTAVLGLALAAVFALAPVSAFADSTIGTANGTASHDVKATYVAGTPGSTVYSVEITWGEMEFTYTAAAEGTWDPTTHTYDNGEGGGNWTANGNTVKVTNHSNTDVTATLTYTAAEGFTGIDGRFDNASLPLATAVNTSVENAPNATSTLTLYGTLDPSVTTSTTVGTITVTLG